MNKWGCKPGNKLNSDRIQLNFSNRIYSFILMGLNCSQSEIGLMAAYPGLEPLISLVIRLSTKLSEGRFADD
jgi:hypothetical protein